MGRLEAGGSNGWHVVRDTSFTFQAVGDLRSPKFERALHKNSWLRSEYEPAHVPDTFAGFAQYRLLTVHKDLYARGLQQPALRCRV